MHATDREAATGNQSFVPGGGPEEAIVLIDRALSIVDMLVGADDVGAHLDLAKHRLRDWLDQPGAR